MNDRRTLTGLVVVALVAALASAYLAVYIMPPRLPDGIETEAVQAKGVDVIDRRMQINGRLTVNQKGTEDIVRFQDNGTNKFTLYDGGGGYFASTVGAGGAFTTATTITATGAISTASNLATAGNLTVSGNSSTVGTWTQTGAATFASTITATGAISTAATLRGNGLQINAGTVTLPSSSVANAALAAPNALYNVPLYSYQVVSGGPVVAWGFRVPVASTAVSGTLWIEELQGSGTLTVTLWNAGSTIQTWVTTNPAVSTLYDTGAFADSLSATSVITGDIRTDSTLQVTGTLLSLWFKAVHQ